MQFDLIVVGGGHNGLVCAACAARAGLSVLVTEKHERVGGAAFTEEFWPGFRNSAASYTVSLLDPVIMRELDLASHGLRIVPRPLENFVPSLDGPGLALPADADERLAEIARFSQADAGAYAGYTRELAAVVRLLRPLFRATPIDPLTSLADVLPALTEAARALAAGPATLKAASRLLRQSAGERLDGIFESDLLKGALGFDSVVGHFASPYQQGTAYLLLHHAFGEIQGRAGAWGHAIGGMGSIADAIARSATESGAIIRTGEPVASIRPVPGGFEVESPSGVFTARRVAGAIHPQRLFIDLLRDAEIPHFFEERIRGWRSESASFRINVALSELPDFTSLPGRKAARHHGAGILLTPSLAWMDRAYEDAVATGLAERPIVELVIPSVIDDSLAPPGAHVASLFCQHFRYTLPGGRHWDDQRDAAVERIVATVTEFAPNFSLSVIGLKAYSPLDLERRFGLVGGDIFHGAMIRGQLYHQRPARGFARYRTPVAGLYLCGSGAHPGGGVSGLPGRNAAAAILADAGRGRGSATRRP
jgi:phytoene dehydrogenase-like protein